jgi:hypothetical protein
MPSTRLATTILLVEQKTRLSRFLPKELLEVCIFSYWIPFANKNLLLVITRELWNDRKQRKTQTIIEFTIVAISKPSDPAELNMEEAVAQGKDAFNRMKPAPTSSFEPIQGAIDASVTVINDTKSLSNTWGPLLQKIELFTKLVDAIAEVRPRTHHFGGL